MAILILTSAGGSPGVTTLAVGLALTWPRPVLLADCDPGAHQAILAGYLAGQSSHGKGLLRVAEAHRDRRPLREVVIDQCLPLTGEDGDRRLFLPGFTKPGSAAHFGAVWEDLADTFDRLGDVDLDVIIDAGRVGPARPAGAAGRAQRAHRPGARLEPARGDVRPGPPADGHRPLPAVVDRPPPVRSGRRRRGSAVRPRRDQQGARACRWWPTIAADPQAAAHLSDGAHRPRRFDSSPLVRSIRGAANALATTLQRSTELVRS